MYFCPMPWIHQAIRNNGDLRVCCQANQGDDKGILRKDDGTAYNAEYDDLEESRNCQKMKDIRFSIMNDKWHPECIRCERESKSQIRTRLSDEVRYWKDTFSEKDIENVTEKDGTINVDKIPIVYYDLRFGNKCNLTCRMCGPTDSSAWYEDYYKLWGGKYFDTVEDMEILKVDGKYKVKNNIYDWYKGKSFWNNMKKNIPNIKLVQIVGGEPFLIEEQFDFLEMCIDAGYSKNIIIEHNSNMVYIPDRVWDIWKHFKTIRIGASMDGIGKINDYIRYPSKWENIYENIRKIDNAEGNFETWIAATIQVFNILHLPELLNWRKKEKFNRERSFLIYPHPLHSPHFLNIKMLPHKVKLEIRNKIQNYNFNELDKFDVYNKSLITQYCDYMFQDDYPDNLHKFWHHTNTLDKIRNQSLEEDIPELYDLIGDTNG